MANIFDQVPTPSDGQLKRFQSAGSASRNATVGQSLTANLNDRTGFALIAVIAISAVPYASNRPFFWGLWALVLCFFTLIYSAALFRLNAQPRRTLGQLPITASLFTLVGFWMGFQLIPMGPLVDGFEFATQTGAIINSDTLSLSAGETFLALLKWCTYGLLFYLFLQVGAKKKRARRLSTLLMFIVTAEALYAFVSLLYLNDALLLTEKAQYQGDATGTFVNKNSFATYLAMGAVLAAALATPSPNTIATESGKPSKTTLGAVSTNNVIAFACLVIICTALIATNSRMGVLAGLFGVLLVLSLRLPSRRWKLLTFFGILAAGGAAFTVFGEQLFHRLLFALHGAETRSNLYTQVLSMIADRPLVGFGADTFQVAYPLYQSPPVPTDLVYDKAHSTYLTHWAELGLIVGTLLLLMLAGLSINLVRYMIRTRSRTVEICAALGVIAVAAVHSFVDFSLEIQAVVFLFIAIVALGISETLASDSSNSPKD